MEFFGLTLSLSDLGTIVAMLISIVSLTISILVFLKNRQRDKANVKVEFVKNDIKTDGENKTLDSYINLKNIGGLSTTIEKLDVIINNKLLKENPQLFETAIFGEKLSVSNIVNIPFDLSPDKTLSLMIKVKLLPTENLEKFEKVETKIKHTYGKSSITHIFSV